MTDWCPVNNGMSFSSLSRFLVCRERYRLYREGYRDEEDFNQPQVFGEFFHIFEEYPNNVEAWQEVSRHALELSEKYPTEINQITRNAKLAERHHLVYRQHYAKPKVGYQGSSYHNQGDIIGREIKYRYTIATDNGPCSITGYIDTVRMTKDGIVWCQETKTRGHINTDTPETLHLHLQPMMYYTALMLDPQVREFLADVSRQIIPKNRGKYQLGGIVYNYIVRPYSHRNSPKKRKNETQEQLDNRFFDWLRENPDKESDHFMRYTVSIYGNQIEQFVNKVLRPQLNLFMQWYNADKETDDPWNNPYHSMTPFGVYNPLQSGYGGPFYRHFTKPVLPEQCAYPRKIYDKDVEQDVSTREKVGRKNLHDGRDRKRSRSSRGRSG